MTRATPSLDDTPDEFLSLGGTRLVDDIVLRRTTAAHVGTSRQFVLRAALLFARDPPGGLHDKLASSSELARAFRIPCCEVRRKTKQDQNTSKGAYPEVERMPRRPRSFLCASWTAHECISQWTTFKKMKRTSWHEPLVWRISLWSLVNTITWGTLHLPSRQV